MLGVCVCVMSAGCPTCVHQRKARLGYMLQMQSRAFSQAPMERGDQTWQPIVWQTLTEHDVQMFR